MDNLGDGLKKVLLAGIGAVAVTAEKSKEILDEMVKRGELTVEQGKVLNKELKHNIRKTVKENVKVSVKPSSPEELSELLDQMTPEQMEALKAGIQEKEEKQKPQKDLSVFYSDIENKLKSILGAKIAIKASNNDKGKIEINYYSQDELDRITEMLYSINKEMM